MVHLGGSSLVLGEEVGFGSRESIADFGRVLSQYVDLIVIRAKKHQTVVELASYCTCPVINGLTDKSHPCQALADLYTLQELRGNLRGQTLAWIGDANNVASSLAKGCGLLGMKFIMATPKGYQFSDSAVAKLKVGTPDLELTVTTDPARAVKNATAIYTDVWASMGQEKEAQRRRTDFAPFQVNEALLKQAPPEVVFMHCLPAKRGEEVTDGVIDGPRSIVVQQAANRMHVQKGAIAWLLQARS
jgi:ornithine carbamoyltransferase